MRKSLKDRLAILSDAAKYDASCASSGTAKRDSAASGGLGSTEGSGICHAYAPDGRCISLLKILMTNFCIYDCAYCVNRSSSNVERARFSADEVVWLTIEFYRRNYIEGLFLSSGIIRSSDYTMEEMVRIARTLRTNHGFRGYIHLKTIPEASQLVIQAGAMSQGGDLFILDMGQPVKIIDLARRIIELSGYSVRDDDNPDGDIELAVMGLRPGEKLYEELLIGDNPMPTQHPRIMKAREDFLPWPELEAKLAELDEILDRNDIVEARAFLQTLVSGYKPTGEVVDLINAERASAPSEHAA